PHDGAQMRVEARVRRELHLRGENGNLIELAALASTGVRAIDGRRGLQPLITEVHHLRDRAAAAHECRLSSGRGWRLSFRFDDKRPLLRRYPIDGAEQASQSSQSGNPNRMTMGFHFALLNMIGNVNLPRATIQCNGDGQCYRFHTTTNLKMFP